MSKLLSLIIVFAGVFLAILLWYWSQLRALDANNETRRFIEVPEGSSVAAVANDLEEQGVIRSAAAYRWYTKFHGLETSLQAGTFSLHPAQSIPEIIEELSGKMMGEVIVTIPEGFTVKDIDALLAEKELFQPEDIQKCAQECDFSAYEFLQEDTSKLAKRGGKLEGYLFPDTYFVFPQNTTPESFLKRLLDTFERRVVEGLRSDLAGSERSLHEVVTMASIIEEETRTDDERQVVSGILWKRFDAGMGLDVDAANRYILEKPIAAINRQDLGQDSPYNLRRYRGLPPGPIANPGLASIRAALRPKDSPYFYYLHGTDGQIRYAETNDQHNENKAKYLK